MKLNKWPIVTDNHRYLISSAIETGQLSQGNYTSELELSWSNYTKIDYVTAVSSGTSALMLALLSVGVKPDDEVICPVYSWYSTGLAITNLGAKPVFVDSDETYNIDVNKIEQAITDKTKAILYVDVHGLIPDVLKIQELAHNYNVYTVEDAAQAHGSYRYGLHAGSYADVSIFSLQQTKVVFGGEGGLVCTNRPDIHSYITNRHEMGNGVYTPAYNFRIDEMSAACALAGIELVDVYAEQSRINKNLLAEKLSSWYSFVDEPPEAKTNWHRIRVNGPKEHINKITQNNLIPTHKWPRPNAMPFPFLPAFIDYRVDCPVAEELIQTSTCLLNHDTPIWCQDTKQINDYANLILAVLNE
jgi:perosamine synthetase